MTTNAEAAEWYYVGHYGQLGPLTLPQIEELIRDGVIERETFVWRNGMSGWLAAGKVPELASAFTMVAATPPPPPIPAQPMSGMSPPPAGFQAHYPTMTAYGGLEHLPVSDRNRVIAGLLQLLIPGGGRFYLGYMAHGFLQLITMPCVVGVLWAWIDGIIMLCGGVKLDGYGRRMVN